MNGAYYFNAFDVYSGFYHIVMDPESKKLTAFSTPDGQFHLKRMPRGLRNAPATFQRATNYILRGLIDKICYVFLDDIIILGKNLEEHNQQLEILLQRLREYDLKLQPDKCEYLRPEVEYLGHVIMKDDVKSHPNKI